MALSAKGIGDCISHLWQPGNFLVGPALRLEWAADVGEEIFWEIFRGRALDQSQTRQRQAFRAWNLNDRDHAGEPLLGVKWDVANGQVYVVRSILSRAWESYEGENGAILSRETVRRVRELVGEISLHGCRDTATLADELAALLHLAVVGASRLALTSLETPLPEFVHGQLAYVPRLNPGESPNRSVSEFLANVDWERCGESEQVRLYELSLRAGALPPVPCPAAMLAQVLNDLSLTPDTGIIERVLRFAESTLDGEAEVDFLTHVLRQVGRHLTAFDLVKFHGNGLNYPDAILVEAALRRLYLMIQDRPEVMTEPSVTGRLRRRGWRAGWIIRCLYAGRVVPSVPESPGESIRRLEARPDDTAMRTLFSQSWSTESEPLASIMKQCLADLTDDDELRELGTALYLDRPFGQGRHPLEPDRTLLFSYVAFSRSIARARLENLERWFRSPAPSDCVTRLDSPDFVTGVHFRVSSPRQRPGVASLEDSFLAADDMLFLQSTRRSIRELMTWYDVGASSELLTAPGSLLIRTANPQEIGIHDSKGILHQRVRVDASKGYCMRLGTEHPVGDITVSDVAGNQLDRWILKE